MTEKDMSTGKFAIVMIVIGILIGLLFGIVIGVTITNSIQDQDKNKDYVIDDSIKYEESVKTIPYHNHHIFDAWLDAENEFVTNSYDTRLDRGDYPRQSVSVTVWGYNGTEIRPIEVQIVYIQNGTVIKEGTIGYGEKFTWSKTYCGEETVQSSEEDYFIYVSYHFSENESNWIDSDDPTVSEKFPITYYRVRITESY